MKSNFPHRIVVGSDGMGIYGIYTINTILKIAYPKAEIDWNNLDVPDVVIRSHFTNDETHNTYTCPYITWSGESRSVQFKSESLPICQIDTMIVSSDTTPKSFHIPYIYNYLTQRNLYLDYKVDNHHNWHASDFNVSPELLKPNRCHGQRPYFCAYLASNRVYEREYMFYLLLKRTSDRMCHALGQCSYNVSKLIGYPQIYDHVQSYALQREYRQNHEIFKHYRFALVMENININGYVTEKIMTAFKAGAIPIYWGGGDNYIETLFNPKAMINISKFTSFEECADFVVALDQDPIRRRQMQSEPIFINNQVPDLFNGINSKYLFELAQHIKEKLTLFQNPQLLNYINAVDLILWINLETSVDRRQQMETILSKFQPLNLRISAINGKCTDSNLIMSNFKLNTTPQHLKTTQYACLLSHLRTIKFFQDQHTQLQIALILEDDICLDFMPYWQQSIESIIANAPIDWEVIMLSYTSLQTLTTPYTRWTNNQKLDWPYHLNGAVAYVINRKGANNLVSKLFSNEQWQLSDDYQHVSDQVIYSNTITYTYQFPMFTWSDHNTTTIGTSDDYLQFHMKVKKHQLELMVKI